MKRKPAAVQYKDTFEFRLFPQYAYTKAQEKRFRLFQGRIEHWRKAINYADCFCDDDKINLLYMIGYHEKIRDYVQKTKSNVVVLCARFTADELAVYDAYWDFIKRLRGAGVSDENGNLNDWYYMNRTGVYQQVDGGCTDRIILDLAQQYREEEKIIADYKLLQSTSWKRFDRFTILDKLHPEKTISHDNLDWIIKRYFPRGREQRGLSARAYTSVRLVNDALEAGICREDFAKSVGLDGSIPLWEVCKAEIKRCEMNLNTAIRAYGNVDLTEIFHEMRKPPYGWSTMDAHAAYCFGYALSGYLQDGYCWDGVSSFTFRECGQALARHIVRGQNQLNINRCRQYILYTEDGWRMVNRLAYIFGVEKELPLTTMILRVCCAIEKHTRFPVSILDEGLFDLFNCRYMGHELFDIDVMREFLKHFDWIRCEKLKEQYETINVLIPKMIEERVPGAPMDRIAKYCTTKCSGWCWGSSTFWETVERYSKESPNNGD